MAIDNHFNCTSTAQNNHSNLYHIKTITEYTLRTMHNNSNSQHTENCGGVTVQRNREYYVKDKAILQQGCTLYVANRPLASIGNVMIT